MTIDELQIQLDLNVDDKAHILDEYAAKCLEGYFFVDYEDGNCYLFDEYGNLNDVNKIKTISEDCIKKDIKKIVIPDSVTNIGSYVFSRCSSLTSVTIGNSVTSIGNTVFYKCSGLTSVTIPDSVTSIGHDAFYECRGLTSATIPNSVASIGDWAFSNCRGLMNVTILGGAMRIGCYAFSDCSNLKSVVFKNKTMDQVRSMKKYPFGIADESIIKCQS